LPFGAVAVGDFPVPHHRQVQVLAAADEHLHAAATAGFDQFAQNQLRRRFCRHSGAIIAAVSCDGAVASAAEIARLFGVHPATVSRLTARARNTPEAVLALADSFEQILR
jgi:hypothetical protein